MKITQSIILITVLGLSSCRPELLSPVPQTTISDAVAFETPERTLQAVNGMYAGIKVGTFYGGRYYNYQDVRGEEFLNETSNGVTNLQTWNFTIQSSTNEVSNLWGAAYAAINRINVVLKGLETSPISDVLKTQYKGEAYFLRALAYHSLITIYARPYADANGTKPGVIIYTEPQTSAGENNKERATVAEVYKLIVDDLNLAETNLPASYPASANAQKPNVTRAHKNAAIALKTRVYLHMAKYAEVITEANKIVPAAAPFETTSGVKHALEPNIANVFGANGQTAENIFSFPFSALDLPGTQNSLNQYYSPGTAGGNGDYSLNLANGIVADANWTATDARRAFNQATSGKTYLRKWQANTDYVPVIRYAEVLLNLAEALARTTALDARATLLLNAVRMRSDPATVLAPTTQAEQIDMILIERRIELLGEGFRSRDLSRLLLPFPAKGAATSVAPTDNQYIWPIPQSELLVNKTISQNTGY
jgi:hypothetical protein